MLAPQSAIASGTLRDRPWAVWDYKDKPVRGGYFRAAVERYIGKMNPNHWLVLDWISMGYFHERLMLTDGEYKTDGALAARGAQVRGSSDGPDAAARGC